MNSKRLLTLLMAICLMVSVIAPAAGAVQAGVENTTSSIQQGENASTGNWFKDLLVSAGNALGIKTLRDDQSYVVDKDSLSFVDGQWIATSTDGMSVVLSDAQLPEDVQALRKAAEHYTAQDVVYAFVTLKADPTAELYGSIAEVPDQLTAAMTEQQNALISTIEQVVLNGEKLDVVAQFTHLTNSVVVAIEFGNLESIAALSGVKSVFLNPVYEVCKTSEVAYPATTSSTVMTNVASVWQDLGYTGKGMTIAILDTGLDLDHPSFAADPAGASWTMETVQSMLDTYELNAEELYSGTLTAEDLYYSAKVPFTFNYAMGNTNVSHADGLGDHGTHVAGIAAANNVEGSGVVGMAPDAQIIAMKVFNSETGGSNMYDLIEALEDCMILGVDVVNMSLGSPAGFSYSEIEEIDSIFARINESDMIVDVAAGNEGTSSFGSHYGYYMQTTTNIDNATISSPSTYANSMAIGSVDNAYVYSSVLTIADGTEVFYMQCAEWHNGYIADSLEILAGSNVEYVIVPNLGNIEDFYDENGNSIVEGKIAVIKRGETTFADKTLNAQEAGAVGVLIWDNQVEDIFNFGMSVAAYDADGNEYYPDIPAVLISLEDGQILSDAEEKWLNVAAEPGIRPDPNGGQVSSFSCWGVAPDLRLLPDIVGVGGNIYSCYDGGEYGLMSGTSMATPQVAGVTALVLQYLKEAFPEATDAEIRVLCDSLMMSSAVTVIDNATGLEASPRQQGAGLVDALAAITAEAYLTVEGCERPKAELGDDENGEFTFTFTVHNFSDSAKTYNLRASLLCEDFVTDEAYPDEYFMAEYDHALDNSAVSFSLDTVTVEAGSSVDVTVTIKLTEDDKKWIDTYFPSGNYVEGYIYLEGEGEVTLSLPFLGFYGSWDTAPVFDFGYWYDNGFWSSLYEEIDGSQIDANEYYHVLWTDMAGSEWVLGINPYEGVQIDENGNVVYSEYNNVISPNGDGVLDQITEFYLSLMRNVEEMTFVYTDAEGNVLHEFLMEKESKTMYISGYGSVVPFVYSWYYSSYPLYDFSGLNDGDVVYLTISGRIDYENSEWQELGTLPLYIDNSAPVLDTDNIVESSDENGNYITLTFEEDHPAFAALMNPSGTQIYARYDERSMVQNDDGSWSLTIDVTGRGDDFVVVLCDYGCNEAYYNLTWSESGTNNPEVDTDALYAYQVYDHYLYYNYGWDYMFGWTTIDKLTGEATLLQSDAYEYYALTAAEYAGGYVFAVDAGYNFLYMVPGLWNRNVICNLGINVVDMAFDETTNTMYLATSDNDNYQYGLYTIDLLTGELTQVKSYLSRYEMPWAMTFVNGELYCCKYYYSGFFKVDLENGTYALSAVTDANGNAFKPKSSVDADVSPQYSQSMTYSEADGKIYWAYYNPNRTQDLIVIDPSDWSYTSTAFMYRQEYVGVLTLEDGGYVLPESESVTKMIISDEQLILGTGATYGLSVTLLPWNAPVTENVVWSSSDESVLTVDDGVVTTIAEGSATVTATYGELSVECRVNVVNIEGNLNAYKYYDGNYDFGYWLDIDLGAVTEEGTVESPVDFIAADYNGHTGIIYGYDEMGQCYWFDPATGEYGALGTASTSLIPADMAYDYSTGFMYAIVYDYNSWSTTLYALNMQNGKLVEMASIYDIFFTLACTTDGLLYGISYDGILYELHLMEGESGGDNGGIGGWEPLDDWFDDDFGVSVGGGEAASYYLYANYVLKTPVDSMSYAQTMCYDHNNDVLLWINVETSSVYWIDGLTSYDPFIISLGDPSGSGLIEYTGAYVVPEQIPELPFFPVTGTSADDMFLLEGQSSPASVNVYPLNATSYVIYNSFSTNPDVAYYDEATGMVIAAGEGTAMIGLGVVDCGEDGVDDGVTDPWYDVMFTVTVKKSTDNIYGYLMTDMYNYDGYYWMNIQDSDPANYTGINYVYYNGVYMTVYAAEYVDGTIYAFGYDDSDWNANFHFITVDAKTWSVVSAVDMGEDFPFVYDMAFDYTTGTMYALAGPNDSTTDLYYVNLSNGQLIEAMATGSDYMFLALTIDDNGTLYAMARSVEQFDWFTWTSTLSNAQLYTLDVANESIDWYMDSGATCNMLTTMAYDHDTGYIYWNTMDSSYNSGLYLIDLEECASYCLGAVGGAGAQVTGMMILADAYPEIPNTISNVAITTTLEELAVGGTVDLDVLVQPSTIDVELSWASSDESVATVDENGVVTAVADGKVTITVTATDSEGNSRSATCTVVVHGVEDYFITYNVTDGGFAMISRPDSTVVTNFTEDETAPAVNAMEMIDGIIYAYDENNNLFITSVENNFRRTYIGNAGIYVADPYENHTKYSGSGYSYGYDYYYTPGFEIRDMAYDASNDRLLVLGCEVLSYITWYWYDSESYSTSYEYGSGTYEREYGCKIYAVDLTTGALEEVCVVGGDYYELGVTMFTVAGNGKAYTYSYTRDYVMEMDLSTGDVVYLTTFQNQGVYGSSDHLMSMTYDEETNFLYMLFTQNGKYYQMFKFNPVTQAITLVDYVGEVIYKYWTYTADSFIGLAVHHGSYENEQPEESEQSGESEEHKTQYPDHEFRPVVIEPTCTNWGCTLHVCTAEGCTESYATDYVPALGHNQSAELIPSTCTEGGMLVCTCVECGEVSVIAEYEAKGHDYEAVVTEATCVEGGYTTYTCSVCGDTYQDDFVDATGEHKFTAEVERKDATCTEDGYVIMSCSCGATQTSVIAKLGHAASEAVVENEIAASCGNDGSYESVVYCQNCGEELSRETVVVSATGEHVYATEVERKDATCTEDGYVIVACGCGTTETSVIEMLGHTAGEAVVENETAASCTEDGSYESVIYCQNCGEELSRETVAVAAEGHIAAGEWVVVKEATSTETGLKVKYCQECGEVVESATIPAQEDVKPLGDNTYLFVIFAVMAMTGCVITVSRKKYF